MLNYFICMLTACRDAHRKPTQLAITRAGDENGISGGGKHENQEQVVLVMEPGQEGSGSAQQKLQEAIEKEEPGAHWFDQVGPYTRVLQVGMHTHTCVCV